MNTRPLRAGDYRVVEEIFAATVALGRPLPFDGPGFDAYRDLCLGWYLGPGRDDVVVLEHLGRVVGYTMVCLDGVGHRRWARTEGASWTLRAVRDIVAGRLPREAERFHRLRLRDGWAALVGPPPPCGAHLHVNVAAGHRGGQAGRLLLEAAEERFRIGGVRQWYAEINAPVGRRGAALGRQGGRIVARRPSHTFSWLAGRPIEQLRVTRLVPTEARSRSPRRATGNGGSAVVTPTPVPSREPEVHPGPGALAEPLA